MQKSDAVAAMGPSTLLLPAWIKAALAANDRLKLYLTVLQAAAAHAEHPDTEPLDLGRETAAAGVEGRWLRDLPAGCSKVGGALLVPELRRLVQRLAEDLGVMAKPLLEAPPKGEDPSARVKYWLDWLATIGSKKADGETLTREQLRSLTDGKRGHGGGKSGRDDDSFHLLVMDLHKQINHLAGTLSHEQIGGAHVWQLQAADRPRVEAFMRGLNRTAPLRFDHPGLDTAATRDGKRLLLQNDIGTNDAHVLVVQVEGKSITLNYSDLHRPRFEFFQALLAPFGAKWADTQSKVDAALNDGQAYIFGTAHFVCTNEAALDKALEGIASRIVFLIDWNRARKRLLPFVGKAEAIEVLREVARLDAGHMAWLKSGGEQVIFAAMQAAGEGAFRIGDRLDAVLGTEDARAFLVEVLCLASKALLGGQPAALVADETRMLLARRMRQRSSEFDLIEEHAAYCHALAQAVSDGLAHDVMAQGGKGDHQASGKAARGLAARAKVWERQADHLVMRARDNAQRQRRWQPVARLLELSDDIADALEEAAFLMSLIAEDHRQGWNAEVHQILSRLAQSVLSATQEHIKALAIARRLGAGSDAADSDAFLAASWNVLRSERECDELLRAARRAILASIRDAAALMLANDLAMALELASDRLLVAGYALRDVVFDQAGARA
ncbi:MAG: phosphate transport regulator [Burkholderiaceae bacterium]|nr:phosphate transport regulator [Burkholderiaceae bacterium]